MSLLTNRSQVEDAFRKVLDSHIDHSQTYGASGIAFCMKKQVLEKRLGVKTPCNGAMVQGKLWHQGVLEKVVPLVYPEDHVVRASLREYGSYEVETEVMVTIPHIYEKIVHARIGPCIIEGHCDVDLPQWDRIIELKTTSHTGPVDPSSFLIQCYIQQANAYACLLGRGFWELWIVFKDFTDINSEEFVSVLVGKANPTVYETYCQRVQFIDAAVKDPSIVLTGPEAGWECNQCHFVPICDTWTGLFAQINGMLPLEKKSLPPDLEKAFALMGNLNMIFYDRSAKKWKVSP